MGPRNGVLARSSEAEAPIIEGTSGSLMPVGRDRPRLDLDLFAVPFGKERADRPVDQAGGQDFLVGGPPFALDEAAGKLARGVGLFTVVDGEREEVEALPARGGHAGHQRHGVADPHDHRPAGLLGQPAGFQICTDGSFNDR